MQARAVPTLQYDPAYTHLNSNMESELQESLISKERLITRLYHERIQLEEENTELREIIAKLKKSLSSKNQIKIQISLPALPEIAPNPIVEVVTID